MSQKSVLRVPIFLCFVLLRLFLHHLDYIVEIIPCPPFSLNTSISIFLNPLYTAFIIKLECNSEVNVKIKLGPRPDSNVKYLSLNKVISLDLTFSIC